MWFTAECATPKYFPFQQNKGLGFLIVLNQMNQRWPGIILYIVFNISFNLYTLNKFCLFMWSIVGHNSKTAFHSLFVTILAEVLVPFVTSQGDYFVSAHRDENTHPPRVCREAANKVWSRHVTRLSFPHAAPERGPDFWRILQDDPDRPHTKVTLLFKVQSLQRNGNVQGHSSSGVKLSLRPPDRNSSPQGFPTAWMDF